MFIVISNQYPTCAMTKYTCADTVVVPSAVAAGPAASALGMEDHATARAMLRARRHMTSGRLRIVGTRRHS